MEPSSRRQRVAELARTEWPTVRQFLGCECTDPEPAACTGSPDDAPGGVQCGPAPTHRQCSCHHIRTEAEHQEIRTAVQARQFDAAQVLRDFSAAAGRSPHPDGAVWTEALKWASARVRGGHASIYADQEFGERFGTHPYRSEWAQPDRP
jgi:hypothetical protein